MLRILQIKRRLIRWLLDMRIQRQNPLIAGIRLYLAEKYDKCTDDIIRILYPDQLH